MTSIFSLAEHRNSAEPMENVKSKTERGQSE